MDLDDAVATAPKSRRRKTAGAKKAIEITEDQEDDSQEQLVMNLLDIVADATPDELVARQDKMTSTLLRLKELQDQQPPKVSFSPSIANSCRERLEGVLIFLTSELSAIPASNWASYKKKLIKLRRIGSNSQRRVWQNEKRGEGLCHGCPGHGPRRREYEWPRGEVD